MHCKIADPVTMAVLANLYGRCMSMKSCVVVCYDELCTFFANYIFPFQCQLLTKGTLCTLYEAFYMALY